jgi:hypothetical protein
LNKKKIIKDPVYGFITVHSSFILEIIEHPYFQRLRRIKQLGLTDLVYPGAIHTRFNHALGAMHLMGLALDTLRNKGHEISEEEYESALIAVLLHDVGHGPFSHVLEKYLLSSVPHEIISSLIMEKLNSEFAGRLTMAIAIFKGSYSRPFLHQLVSGQMDMDRMDYLNRDCFYTGVDEGTIGGDRIIKMLNLVDDQLVIEEKAIYSIENFLNSRRLMYWQVYLHKTTVAVEQMLNGLILRARKLVEKKTELYGSPVLLYFLQNEINAEKLRNDEKALTMFLELDDYDVWGAIKVWAHHEDPILSDLSARLINRRLFKVILSSETIDKEEISEIKSQISEKLELKSKHLKYYVQSGKLSNSAYLPESGNINILMKDGRLLDVSQAADLPNIKAISKIVKKYYLCFPKNVYLRP